MVEETEQNKKFEGGIKMIKFKDKPHLKIIMKEMCKQVKAQFSKIDFKKKNWFMKYEWTEHEQEEFKNWLKDYLKNNLEARREIMEHPTNNNKFIEKTVNWFCFDYGWKIKP